MKTHKEIREIAREGFTANYWPVVGITITFSIIAVIVAYTVIGVVAIPAVAVAMSFFYIATYFGDTDNEHLANVLNVGFEKFGRNFGCQLFKGIMLLGWSCLLLIPGIIKSYSYAMTEYILADCPNVKTIDAITISRRMMDGHKWDYFVFRIKFIGWNILAIITFGIVGVFYSTPYMQTACAGYYAELKKLVIDEGVVTADQFAGGPLDTPTTSTYTSTPAPTPAPETAQTAEAEATTAETEATAEAAETEAVTLSSGVVFEE